MGCNVSPYRGGGNTVIDYLGQGNRISTWLSYLNQGYDLIIGAAYCSSSNMYFATTIVADKDFCEWVKSANDASVYIATTQSGGWRFYGNSSDKTLKNDGAGNAYTYLYGVKFG